MKELSIILVKFLSTYFAFVLIILAVSMLTTEILIVFTVFIMFSIMGTVKSKSPHLTNLHFQINKSNKQFYGLSKILGLIVIVTTVSSCTEESKNSGSALKSML